MPLPARMERPRVEELSPERHKLQMTISGEVRKKLERACDLLRHRNPSGDFGFVVEKALDVLIESLERQVLAKTKRPAKANAKTKRPAKAKAKAATAEPVVATPPPATKAEAVVTPVDGPNDEAVPRAARREVFERDGNRCTFVSAAGERCPATTLLEIDHILSRALGGTNEVPNLRLCCRAHNRLHAERVFGRAHVEEKIRLRQRSSTKGKAT